MSLSNLFVRLLYLTKFMVPYFSCYCMTWFYDPNDFEQTFLPHVDEWKESVKRKLISISSESYKQFIFWLIFFIKMVQVSLKIIWWQFLVVHSERLSISSATVSCNIYHVTCSISIFWISVLQKKLFSEKFLTYACTIHFINHNFKTFCV